MSTKNPLVALFVREILPMVIIVAVATVAQRMTHNILTGTK